MPPTSAGVPLQWEQWAEPGFHRTLEASRGRLLLALGREGCGACRAARARIPDLAVGAVDRLAYLDAESCAGLVREFEVFHLPAMFLFRDGRFHAPLAAPLTAPQFAAAVEAAFAAPPEEAP
jgi:thioredoxin-like negative regulator of GroEL